jgi:OOP family OmpA-OmpF porin
LQSYTQGLKDCREGDACTAADLAQALFPAPEPVGGLVRTRGVGPRRDASSAPKPAAVALQVQFATNSDVILPPYYAQLDALGHVLAQPQYATYRIQIEGHTDSVGADQANQVLSQQRAESVRRYLLQHFPLPLERLTAVGYGNTQPLASNATPAGRQKNRRVQVVNLGQ